MQSKYTRLTFPADFTLFLNENINKNFVGDTMPTVLGGRFQDVVVSRAVVERLSIFQITWMSK